MNEERINAERATLVVRKYFEKIHGNLGLLFFKIEKVEPNTDETFWIVDCSFFPSLGGEKRTYYRVKVNIKTGEIVNIEEIEKNA